MAEEKVQYYVKADNDDNITDFLTYQDLGFKKVYLPVSWEECFRLYTTAFKLGNNGEVLPPTEGYPASFLQLSSIKVNVSNLTTENKTLAEQLESSAEVIKNLQQMLNQFTQNSISLENDIENLKEMNNQLVQSIIQIQSQDSSK